MEVGVEYRGASAAALDVMTAKQLDRIAARLEALRATPADVSGWRHLQALVNEGHSLACARAAMPEPVPAAPDLYAAPCPGCGAPGPGGEACG